METELKLLIAPADVAALRRLAMLKQLATAKPASRLLRTTYFDTPELLLAQQGMELRVRRIGRVSMQTLKAGSQVATAGLHQRQEWEARVAGARPELASLIAQVSRVARGGVGPMWHKVISMPGLAQTLVPVFASEVRRTVWNLRCAQGTEVELALDQGELRRGDQREPISEVELELKAGAPAALFDLALLLQEQVPLRVGNFGKAARGYALRDPAAAAAVKAAPLVLGREVSVEEGFRLVVGHCLAQMQAEEAGVMRGADPESIHQMRVGMRRLRSALRLFARWMTFPPTLQQELGWLGGELGTARDADVLADSTLLKVIEANPQEAKLLPLRRYASTLAAQKRRKAAVAVASLRYSRLMLGLVGWLQASRWREALDETALGALAGPLKKHATQILSRRHDKLLKSAPRSTTASSSPRGGLSSAPKPHSRKIGKRLAQATVEQRHQMRIAAKKARYATEFFQSLRATGHVKRYLKRLEILQDALGWLNDAAVAAQRLREIEACRPELAGSASFARGFLCAAATRELPALGRLWKRVSSMASP